MHWRKFSQSLIDSPELGAGLGEFLARFPDFQDNLEHNTAQNWLQNPPGEHSVVDVWGYLLDAGRRDAPRRCGCGARLRLSSTSSCRR